MSKDLEEDKGQRILVLEVESSITGEAQREHERSTNGSSSKTTKNGSLKRTRSQYEDDQDEIIQKSVLGDFAAIVGEHGWHFDVKLGEDKVASISSLQRWLALERRLREKSKISFRVLSPRGTTITQAGIKGMHKEGDFKGILEILRPKGFQPTAKEGVPCLRLVEVIRSPSPSPVHANGKKDAAQGYDEESEESEEDPDGEIVHNIRINSHLLWNIKHPNQPQLYVSPTDPFSFYPGPGRYQGI